MQINKDSIDQAINSQTACLFNGVFDSVYNWNNFIQHINFSYCLESSSQKTNANKKKGFVNFWQDLTLTVDNVLDSIYPGIEKNTKYLQSFIKSKYQGRFVAISLTTCEPTTGKHNDPVNVMYWNVLGQSKWEIFYDDRVDSFILNPGDLIFVPAGLMHEVTSITPRAAISFMFGTYE